MAQKLLQAVRMGIHSVMVLMDMFYTAQPTMFLITSEGTWERPADSPHLKFLDDAFD